MMPDKLYLHRTTGSPRLNGKVYSYKPAKIRDDDKIIEYIRKGALIDALNKILEARPPEAKGFASNIAAMVFQDLIERVKSL